MKNVTCLICSWVMAISVGTGCARTPSPPSLPISAGVVLTFARHSSYEGKAWDSYYANVTTPFSTFLADNKPTLLKEGFRVVTESPESIRLAKGEGAPGALSVTLRSGRAYLGPMDFLNVDKAATGTAIVVKQYR